MHLRALFARGLGSVPLGIGLLIVALVPAVLNAVQPLVVDDPVYYDFTRHLLQHPFDPYGGGRLDVLVPPVLPYWGAATMRLLGESIALVKLGLVPFVILLTVGIYALAKQFASGLENYVAAMAVLSPWVLPGFNYMLDVPAYGLGIAALALFIAGCDRRSRGLVVAAGLLAGLAVETKYNLATIPAAMFAYALIYRRYGDGLLACAFAAAVFVSCEIAIMAKYGHSNFVFHLEGRANWSKLIGLTNSIVGYRGLGGRVSSARSVGNRSVSTSDPGRIRRVRRRRAGDRSWRR
jgi:4-amino-4-deoxy-L-arabinose transferase-like glycosyltransferase